MECWVNPTKIEIPTRVWNRLSSVRVSEIFVLLTQIPLLVSMETVCLTSPWLPWCLVLEDLSRLYTARDKQGLQTKLLLLPSCHHLLRVTRSNWGWGDDDRMAGLGPETRRQHSDGSVDACRNRPGVSCWTWCGEVTAAILLSPCGMGACVWEAWVLGDAVRGPSSVLGLDLDWQGPQEVFRAPCRTHTSSNRKGNCGGFPR